MIKRINGDLTKVTGKCIIAHQVNPRVLGPVLAVALAHAYPECERDFRAKASSKQPLKLGEVMMTRVRPGFYVAHCCGQLSTVSGVDNTSLTAVHTYLTDLNRKSSLLNLPVLIPNGIGCGRAGGDWNKVFPLIQETMTEARCYLVKWKERLPIHVDELEKEH